MSWACWAYNTPRFVGALRAAPFTNLHIDVSPAQNREGSHSRDSRGTGKRVLRSIGKLKVTTVRNNPITVGIYATTPLSVVLLRKTRDVKSEQEHTRWCGNRRASVSPCSLETVEVQRGKFERTACPTMLRVPYSVNRNEHTYRPGGRKPGHQ